MGMILDLFRNAVAAVRPPRAGRILALPCRDISGSILTLTSATTPAEALNRLARAVQLPASDSVLVVPSTALRSGAGAHPQVVAGLLEALGSQAMLGTPASTPQPVQRRWEGLAAGRGARSLTLGAAGWDRVELAGEAFLLDEVLVPAELADAGDLIFVPAIGDEALALGFVRGIVHPHTRMRARGNANRTRLDAEIAATVSAHYLLDASRLHGSISASVCLWADDALSAELAGVGIQRLVDTRRGFESVSAWEHERVQAATELGLGPPAGDAIVLRAERDGGPSERIAGFLRDELSCRVEWIEGEDER